MTPAQQFSGSGTDPQPPCGTLGLGLGSPGWALSAGGGAGSALHSAAEAAASTASCTCTLGTERLGPACRRHGPPRGGLCASSPGPEEAVAEALSCGACFHLHLPHAHIHPRGTLSPPALLATPRGASCVDKGQRTGLTANYVWELGFGEGPSLN